MRGVTQQTTAAMVEQSRAVTQIAAQAEETAAVTQRTIGGLTEQARGAGEVARAMDEARRQCQNA